MSVFGRCGTLKHSRVSVLAEVLAEALANLLTEAGNVLSGPR
ncbi:hypothetical protein [Saccharopolyspora hattusasensis]